MRNVLLREVLLLTLSINLSKRVLRQVFLKGIMALDIKLQNQERKKAIKMFTRMFLNFLPLQTLPVFNLKVELKLNNFGDLMAKEVITVTLRNNFSQRGLRQGFLKGKKALENKLQKQAMEKAIEMAKKN